MRQGVLLPKLAIVGEDFVTLRLRERPPIGARGKLQQGVQVTRLGLEAGTLGPSDGGVRTLIMFMDRFDDFRVIRAESLQRQVTARNDRLFGGEVGEAGFQDSPLSASAGIG